MAEKRGAREVAAACGGLGVTSAAAGEPRPGAKRGPAAAGAPTALQRAKAPRGNPAGAGVYVPPAARAAAAAPAPAPAAKAGAAVVAAARGSGDVRRIKSLQELLDEKKRAAQQEQQVATGKPAARQQPAAKAKAMNSPAEADLTSVLSTQAAPWDPTRRGSRGGSGGVKKAAKKARREQEAAAASAPSTCAPAPASQAQEAAVAGPPSALASAADDMDAELLDFEDDGEEVGDIDFEKEMLDMEALVATS